MDEGRPQAGTEVDEEQAEVVGLGRGAQEEAEAGRGRAGVGGGGTARAAANSGRDWVGTDGDEAAGVGGEAGRRGERRRGRIGRNRAGGGAGKEEQLGRLRDFSLPRRVVDQNEGPWVFGSQPAFVQVEMENEGRAFNFF